MIRRNKMNLLDYYKKAMKNNFALGAINFCNMESLQGIIEACKETSSPMIIAVSESALNYMGNFTTALASAGKKDFPHLFLHLDHGKNFDICKKAVDMGFDSVMIDGSSLPYEENIALTQKVCEYAHSKNVFVEGELGQLQGIEDNVQSDKSHYTCPKQAKEFVMRTNVDSLAVAIGTSHGAYKYSGEKTLRFDILSEIESLLPSFPLVLHGASSVDTSIIERINKYGGDLSKASGIPKNLLEKAVKGHNIVKINTDTDIRLAVTSQVRQVLAENPKEFDPRKYLGSGREQIKNLVIDKINNVFFSNNQI